MDARTLAAQIKRDNPGKRIAVGGGKAGHYTEGGENAIAYWDDSAGWVMFAGKLISEGWARIGNLCIDGKPCVDNWVEV